MGKSAREEEYDTFYRRAKGEGYRARSAYKLLQLLEQIPLLCGVSQVVDLCAAPGSWSQVLASKLQHVPNFLVVAVDIQAMAPIPSVITLQGDLTLPSTIKKITASLSNTSADLVVFDGAPDLTGLHELDGYLQDELLFAAMQVILHVLKRKGSFVAKTFRCQSTSFVLSKFHLLFAEVTLVKPSASRKSSTEVFLVARGFNPPHDNPIPEHTFRGSKQPLYLSFLQCGDLSRYDPVPTETNPS